MKQLIIFFLLFCIPTHAKEKIILHSNFTVPEQTFLLESIVCYKKHVGKFPINKDALLLKFVGRYKKK